jgi:penicillin-insensitive murein endopeptidase
VGMVNAGRPVRARGTLACYRRVQRSVVRVPSTVVRILLVVFAVLTGAAAPSGPAAGPLHIIGGPALGGCIVGAVRLPDDGTGYQTIHPGSSSFWGAPQTIAGVQRLGEQAFAAGLPTLLVEDISSPRGGPLAGGHVSHQIGLDADVALDMQPRPKLSAGERERVALASLVSSDRRGIEPARWSPSVVTLLRLAATLPGVDRVLVNPAIKRQLCHEVAGDRSWLRTVRPWYGHAAHMHISFRCPADQADCTPLPPPPPGDGCDATLQWWFDQLDEPAKPAVPRKPIPLPTACRAILGEAGR